MIGTLRKQTGSQKAMPGKGLPLLFVLQVRKLLAQEGMAGTRARSPDSQSFKEFFAPVAAHGLLTHKYRFPGPVQPF